MACFLNRVRLENYKSIAHCDVELKNLTFLAGPNGAGKSNFLQALFVNFTFYSTRKNKAINSDTTGDTFIRSGYDSNNCEMNGNFGIISSIHIRSKEFKFDNKTNTKPIPDPSFISYSLNTKLYSKPSEINEDSKFLHSDGKNIFNILHRIQTTESKILKTINSFIRIITPDIEKIWILQAGGYNILQFSCKGSDTPFNASQMSDGTLHALGVLTAIFHAKSAGIPLIGIEEPEAGLHPAAARVLREALIEASEDVQIIVTSHSPDLLDSPDIDPDSILAVVRENGETKIGPIDAASRKSLSEHLFTAGELLRMNQLEPAA
ncbi:AAA family ATPase [Armatimonas sp.]|uniref:AAA family ATPase n=1 Tax=Armatimonas sp. TaxID=1872638 RepID=UPI003751197C